MASATVLIIDDHELFSTSLQIALTAHGVDSRVVSPRSRDFVLRKASELPPGLVALDLDLGRAPDGQPLRGSEMVRSLRAAGWRVLVLSGKVSSEHPGTAAAIAAGALGAVHKSESFEVVLDVILRALAGEVLMEESERRQWLDRSRSEQMRRQDQADRLTRLTRREREVLDRIADGLRAADIAAEFSVALTTIRAQIRAILVKLEVSSQLSAVALARQVEKWDSL